MFNGPFWVNSVKPTAKAMAIPSQAADHSAEGVETTGGKMGCLNYQRERPNYLCRRYSPYYWETFRKYVTSGTGSNLPLIFNLEILSCQKMY